MLQKNLRSSLYFLVTLYCRDTNCITKLYILDVYMYSFRQPFQDAKKGKKKPTSAKKGEEKDKSKDKGRTEFLHIIVCLFFN